MLWGKDDRSPGEPEQLHTVVLSPSELRSDSYRLALSGFVLVQATDRPGSTAAWLKATAEARRVAEADPCGPGRCFGTGCCDTRAGKWVMNHLLPVSLVCGVLLGIAWPWPGVQVGSKVNGKSPV